MNDEQPKDVPEAPVPDSSEEVPAVTVEGELQAITAERDKLAAEKTDLYDRLLRKQAEFDNFRRRSERDRSDFLQFAGMDLARELLPVLDDFERALKVECSDANYAKGVELIHQRLSDILKKMGVEPMEAAGKQFDPNVHEAVVRVPTDEVEDQTVLEEFQKGYNFKGKLLRPAMVKVAVRP
jgi:molecular chaperone GrpE